MTKIIQNKSHFWCSFSEAEELVCVFILLMFPHHRLLFYYLEIKFLSDNNLIFCHVNMTGCFNIQYIKHFSHQWKWDYLLCGYNRRLLMFSWDEMRVDLTECCLHWLTVAAVGTVATDCRGRRWNINSYTQQKEQTHNLCVRLTCTQWSPNHCLL